MAIELIRYCLPDSLSYFSYNPETSSRVTLAALGIGFQPKLSTTDYQLPTTNNRQPITDAIRFVWKTIPSRARVTRDEVSGL